MENEKDPLLEHEEKDDDDDYDDDDDDDDTTHPFHSTPGHSGEEIPMTTMNRQKEKEHSTAETSFIEGSPISRVLTSNEKAWESLTRGNFPMRRPQNSRRPTAKQGSYKSRSLVLARGLILCSPLEEEEEENKG